MNAAIGFRVKTGWTAAVLVAGGPDSPVVLDVSRVELYDPAVKDSGWPFHAGLELPANQAPKVIARLVSTVELVARRSLGDLLKKYKEQGGRLVGAGVVVGSEIDPATIKNPHIRAHAEEGRLYRSVVLAAAKAAGLETTLFVEKHLYEDASVALGKPVPALKKDLKNLGRNVEGDWRAIQKEAALAALLIAGR